MHGVSRRESQQFLRVLSNIHDEKTRYFYMMLGEAIGENVVQQAGSEPVQSNTGPAHLAELSRRLNSGI